MERETMNRLSPFLLVAFFLSTGYAPGTEDDPPIETPIRTLAMRLLEENELVGEYEAMVAEFRREHRAYKPAGRLDRVSRILEDPFLLEPITVALRDRLEECADEGPKGLPRFLKAAADLIDAEPELPEIPLYEPSALAQDHLVHIEMVLDRAAELRASALEGLSESDLELAYDTIPLVIDKFIHHIYLEVDTDKQQMHTLKKGLKALMVVDYDKMVQAAMLLSSLADPDYVKQARKDLLRYKEKIPPAAEEAGFSGDIIAYRETRHGPIVIGGKRVTRYKGRAAFVLDLGGNDTYEAAAATLDKDRGLSMVVDLVGKDKYLCTERESLASARLGVSLLVDLAGDDVYEGTRMVQGFGGGGVGLLWDERGKDRYTSEENSQGSGFFGLGLLVDRDGNDEYVSWLHAQGFGMTRSLGALVDRAGDDRYTATGHYPCTYGQKGVFHASSQGHGTGLRRYKDMSAPVYGGGIGLLLDVEGDDRYDAGNFSQGCGYFFGYGILADREGDDWMRGSRYSQATGAHQAMGIVINDAGDDEYISSVAANQAGTWDVTAGVFLDFEGNDSYKADGLAQGGVAQTAFALLFDGGGNDTYQAGGGATQGSSGSFEYHDIQSFAFLLDVGGGKDSYTQPNRKDNTIYLEKWYGLFADFKAKTIEKVLKARAGKLEGEWGKRGK